MNLPTYPLILIAGPTGIGKTAMAIAIANHLAPYIHAEIIGADSRQIYRQMDIGTAKPSLAERAAVPHHLIDIVDPDQTLTMSEYQREAYRVIDSLHAEGHLPLLVGGTGQYITAVLEGWSAPEVPPHLDLRAELEHFAVEQGSLALFERLRQLDPVSAERMDPFNARRTVRALEVCIITGRPFSEQRTKNPPPYRVLQLGLTREDRELLYQSLDRRIDGMMENGLLDEVRNLNARGYAWNLPSMSGLGYAQLGMYLRGECDLTEAVMLIKRDTHTFVRRQYTWFRKYLNLTWLESPAPESLNAVILDWLAEESPQPKV